MVTPRPGPAGPPAPPRPAPPRPPGPPVPPPDEAPTDTLRAVPGSAPGPVAAAPTAPVESPAPPARPAAPATTATTATKARNAAGDRKAGETAAGDDGAAGSVASAAPRNGLGTPALVLGVLAAATAWSGWAGVVLGLAAVTVGYLGAGRAWKGLATDGGPSLGGLALGLVGLVWGVVVVAQSLFGSGTFGDGLTLDQCLQQSSSAKDMHMCKSQHITEFNQRYPNAAE